MHSNLLLLLCLLLLLRLKALLLQPFLFETLLLLLFYHSKLMNDTRAAMHDKNNLGCHQSLLFLLFEALPLHAFCLCITSAVFPRTRISDRGRNPTTLLQVRLCQLATRNSTTLQKR